MSFFSVDTEDMDGTVQRGIGSDWDSVGEEVVATGSGAGAGLGEVGGVAVDSKLHVTGVIADDGIWMGGGIVEKLGGCLGSGFSACRLGGGNGAESNKHGAIDGSSVVEEAANDLLEAGDTGGF